MTKDKKLNNKIDMSIKIVLVIIIILLLIHNCTLLGDKKYENAPKTPNGNVDIIEIKCDDDNKCHPVVTPTAKPLKIDSLSFAQKNISIKKGTTLGLVVIIKPSELSSSKLNWTSSNPNIVSVDSNGRIRGLEEGTAVITVTSSNGISTTCVVKVTNADVSVKEIKLNTNKMTLAVGDMDQLIAKIEPENTTNRDLVWESSDSSIATIDDKGIVKGIKPGKITITVRTNDGKVKTTCLVEIKQMSVQEIKLSKEKTAIKVGEKEQITAMVIPEDATNKDLVWLSSDPTIAKVDKNGKVTGLKPGKVTITARTKDGKVKATTDIEVKPIEVEEIKLNKEKVSMKVGDKVQIVATIKPNDATDKDFVWLSSNPLVVKVDSTGKVKGLLPGTSTITVSTKDGKIKATCTVEVKPIEVDEIKLNPNKMSVKVGSAAQIVATIKPENATNKDLVWTSSDSSIATVDSEGKVTGLKPGKVTITAKTSDGKVKSTCEVSIVTETIAVEEIKLNNDKLNIKIGSISQLVANIKPENATEREVVWESSNSSIVKVDSTGKVTGLNIGTATITVKTKDGKVKATCIVTVEAIAVDKIVLNTNNTSIKIESSTQLTATVEPDNATDKEIVWESSDPSIATVDGTGKVTGLNTGTVTITAKTKDGKVKATCTVKVEAISVDEIELNTNETTIKVRDTEQLVATVKPNNATDKELVWTSSDNSVAVVDNMGRVIGIKEGVATITVKTKDGKVKATCVVTVEENLIPNAVNVYDEDYDPITWNGSSDLKIFSKSIYDFDDKIAPESSNTYEFIVRNNTSYVIKYNVKFIETNTYDINMKYKLKKNSDYLISNYSKASELIIDEYTLNPNESDVYYLDWKWISGDNDTVIGTNPEAKYGLRIEVEAESINE